MRPSTFSGIHVDDDGREYVTHIPSGTRYYVTRKGNGSEWSARPMNARQQQAASVPTLGARVPTKRERKAAARQASLFGHGHHHHAVGIPAVRNDPPPRARMLAATIRLPRVPVGGGRTGER
jgi:hypothetical protein